MAVLGPFIFTETLLSTLITTAASSPPNSARIGTTSSSTNIWVPPCGVNFEDQILGGRNGPKEYAIYGQSKLGPPPWPFHPSSVTF